MADFAGGHWRFEFGTFQFVISVPSGRIAFVSPRLRVTVVSTNEQSPQTGRLPAAGLRDSMPECRFTVR